MPPLETQHRGDVDDLAAPLRDEVPARRLAQEEGRLQIEVDNSIPVGLGEVDRIGSADHAGIVHQHIEAAELLQGFADDARNGFQRSEIRLHEGESPSERLHFGGGVVGVRAADRSDVGAGFGQSQRDALAEAFVRTGDHGDLALQAEGIAHRQRSWNGDVARIGFT
jgi:hypothetical protein